MSQAFIARLENLFATGASHLEIEQFRFGECLIKILGSARTGALAIAQALIDPRRRHLGGGVMVGTSQLVSYSEGDKEAVTKAMRRLEQVGLAEETQSPNLAEGLQREWRITDPWLYPKAWVAAAEVALADFPPDGRKIRRRSIAGSKLETNHSEPADTRESCGNSASSPSLRSLTTTPSSIPGGREGGEVESTDSEIELECDLLADALYPKYVQSRMSAKEASRQARNPRLIRTQLTDLMLQATRNARAGKDGAGLLLHWIKTGQADLRAEQCSLLAKPRSPEVIQAKPVVPIRRSLHHDPVAIRVWEPLLSEVLPRVIPEESIQTWLAPLTAEAWIGEVLQLRADSESAYRWITQQLEEELKSTGIAMRILPPEPSSQLPD